MARVSNSDIMSVFLIFSLGYELRSMQVAV